jgi:hypothetical protein
MTLQDSIHQLCREHLRTGPDGKAHKVPALLDELRAAVTPGNSMSGGGASGPPIPINADALDLLHEIETAAKSDYYEMTGVQWTKDLARLLPWIVSLDLTDEWRAYLERVTLEWVDAINAFLWPVKPRRKLTGKTCPSCGLALHGEERKVTLSLGCWDSEGNLAKIGDWDIECAGCAAGWSGDQVSWLLKALDTPNVELTQTEKIKV